MVDKKKSRDRLEDLVDLVLKKERIDFGKRAASGEKNAAGVPLSTVEMLTSGTGTYTYDDAPMREARKKKAKKMKDGGSLNAAIKRVKTAQAWRMVAWLV